MTENKPTAPAAQLPTPRTDSRAAVQTRELAARRERERISGPRD